jgi:tetratricopeptide (TPR) repeat protein
MINVIFIAILLLAVVMGLYLWHLVRFMRIPKKVERAANLLKSDEKGAIDLLNHILSIDPGNPDANWIMAQYHLAKKWFILALVYLFEIIKHRRFTLTVTEQSVRETIADTFIETGEYEKAVRQFHELKRNGPLSQVTYKKLIDLSMKIGDLYEARKSAQEAVINHPHDGEFNYLSAVIAYEQKNYTISEHELDEAERKGFRTPECLLLLGKICFITQEYEKAIATFTKLPREYLNSDEIEQFMGQSYFYLNNYTGAIEVLEKTATHLDTEDPHLPETLYLLGCAYELTGELDKATSAWDRIDSSMAAYYEAAQEKVRFYTTVVQSPFERSLVAESSSQFLTHCETLMTAMDFVVKRKVYQDERTIELICTSKKDSYVFYQYYVAISRQTSPAGIPLLKEKLFRKTANRARSLIVIAPWFTDEAEKFAHDQEMSIFTMDVFRKYRVFA